MSSELNRFGFYDTVTADFILAGIKMRLKLGSTTSEDVYLLDLINRCVKRLRNLGTMVPAQADLPITDFKAILPDGFIRFTKNFPIRLFNVGDTANNNGLFITQSSTEEILPVNQSVDPIYLGVATQNVFSGGSNWNIPIFLNGAFYDGLGGMAVEGLDQLTPYITVNVVNNIMYFSTNCTFSYVKISYLSSNLDEDGNILIPAIAEEAITEGVLWMYKQDNDYPAYVWQDHKLNWQKGKAHLKALFNMPDSEQYLFLNKKNNSII